MHRPAPPLGMGLRIRMSCFQPRRPPRAARPTHTLELGFTKAPLRALLPNLRCVADVKSGRLLTAISERSSGSVNRFDRADQPRQRCITWFNGRSALRSQMSAKISIPRADDLQPSYLISSQRLRMFEFGEFRVRKLLSGRSSQHGARPWGFAGTINSPNTSSRSTSSRNS